MIGATAEAQQRKTPGRQTVDWTVEGFVETIAELGPEARSTVERLISWARQHGLRLQLGTGRVGSLSPKLDLDGVVHHVFTVFADGRFTAPFEAMKEPYASEQARLDLIEELNEVLDVPFPLDATRRYPRVPLEAIYDVKVRERMLSIWDQYLADERAANA